MTQGPSLNGCGPSRFQRCLLSPVSCPYLHPVLDGIAQVNTSFTPDTDWICVINRFDGAVASISRESRLRVRAKSTLSATPNRVSWQVTPSGLAGSLGEGHSFGGGNSATFADPLMPIHVEPLVDDAPDPRSK